VVRLKRSYDALRLWPGAVLIKADLVCCCGEQVASVVVKCDIIDSYTAICNISELTLLVKAVDAADVLVLPSGSKIGALV